MIERASQFISRLLAVIILPFEEFTAVLFALVNTDSSVGPTPEVPRCSCGSGVSQAHTSSSRRTDRRDNSISVGTTVFVAVMEPRNLSRTMSVRPLGHGRTTAGSYGG